MNDEEKKQVDAIELEYKKTKQFLHCKSCIEQFLGSPLHDIMTPKDYGMYEVGSYDFTYPDGKVEEISVVWCKRCNKRVWDSRHLRS